MNTEIRPRVVNSILRGWAIASLLGGPWFAYLAFVELHSIPLGVVNVLLSLVSLAILVNFEVQYGKSRRQ